MLLPMMLWSSLHIHPLQLSASDEECADCVQHHCSGHIGQQVQTMHDCVLCQFLTLPMVVATEVDEVQIDCTCKTNHAQCQQTLLTQALGIIVTRGPPVV